MHASYSSSLIKLFICSHRDLSVGKLIIHRRTVANFLLLKCKLFLLVSKFIKDSQKTRKPTEPAGKTAEPSKTGRTVAARNEDNDDEGGSNAVAISLAVVGCLLLLIGVILLVLWFRRRSGRASQEKRRGIHAFSNYCMRE